MKKGRHTALTVEDEAGIEAVALAEFGFGTGYIKEHTGLSPSQITYRLSKGKRLEAMDLTYRQGYRNGTARGAQMVLSHFVSRAEQRIKATLPPMIEHPAPKGASESGRARSRRNRSTPNLLKKAA